MATIHRRENKSGKVVYRIQIRRVPYRSFSLTFSTKKEALKWVKENEEKFINNPKPYFKFSENIRLEIKRQRRYS